MYQQQPNYSGMTVSLSSVSHPQQYMSVTDNRSDCGTKIVSWQAGNGTSPSQNQLFLIMQRPDGKYSIRPSYATNMALDMTGALHNHMHIWSADDNNINQGFIIESNNGNVLIRSHLGGVIDLDLATGGQNGSKIHCWEPTGAANQMWKLNMDINAMIMSGQFPMEGMNVELANVMNGSFLSVTDSQSANGTKVVNWTAGNGTMTTPNQKWRCHRRMNGQFSLHPVYAPHMALDNTGGAANHIHIWTADDNNANQNLSLQPNPSAPGSFIIRSTVGVLDLDLAQSGQNGSKIHFWSQPTGAPNQAWQIRPTF